MIPPMKEEHLWRQSGHLSSPPQPLSILKHSHTQNVLHNLKLSAQREAQTHFLLHDYFEEYEASLLGIIEPRCLGWHFWEKIPECVYFPKNCKFLSTKLLIVNQGSRTKTKKARNISIGPLWSDLNSWPRVWLIHKSLET